MDPIIEVRALRKAFRVQAGWAQMIRNPRHRDIRVALDNIDLEVRKGELFGVLGQNGAGKTTLFKILATLVRPDSGTVKVGGIDVVRDPAGVRRLLVPAVANERSLYWRVSARENLRLYAALFGLRGRESEARVSEVLDVIGLDDVGNKQVGLFSSGMKQRLLVGRALLARPEILLLDEPTRSMDPVNAREFRRFLKRQVLETDGTTVVLATHDQEEVTDLCTRVAVLDRGRLLAVGETQALLASSEKKICAIWMENADHPALESTVAQCGGNIVGSEVVAVPGTGEWHRVRIEAPFDENGASDLVSALVSAGIRISRVTREDLTLADLLDRVRAQSDADQVERGAA